jgi:hypothetical protein
MAHVPSCRPAILGGMSEHVFAWIIGLAVAVLVATATSIAVRVRVLPDVIDISIIPTGAGVGSLGFALFGALRRFDPDRLGRVTLLGTLFGALAPRSSCCWRCW